ncbi:MAG: DNA methyltransferase, partial [Cetobacterium sp.]
MQKQIFKNGVIYQGNIFDILEISLQYHHIITDPPYNITNCKWDKDIDITYFINTSIINENMNIIIFGNEPFSSKIRTENNKYYKYDLIWIKNNVTSFTHAKNMPMKKFENIMIFSTAKMGHENLLKQKRMIYNPQGLIPIDTNHKKRDKGSYGQVYGDRPSHKEFVKQEFTNYPNNVLYFDREKTILHPTQKPVSLLSYLILTYSNQDEVILDGFCGSGSLPIACIETGRKFIGVELDNKYFDI